VVIRPAIDLGLKKRRRRRLARPEIGRVGGGAEEKSNVVKKNHKSTPLAGQLPGIKVKGGRKSLVKRSKTREKKLDRSPGQRNGRAVGPVKISRLRQRNKEKIAYA